MNIWLIGFFLMVIHSQNIWSLHSGCFQNGSYYQEGEKVGTEDPCLLCTCRRGSLNCNLRVCAQLPGLLPPECFVLHHPDDCCPQYFCEKNYHERGIESRTAFEGDPSSNISDCMVDQILYAEGSAVTSLHPCEYCYCVGGQVKCLKPRCMAPLDGCTPIYDKSSCCPMQFNCSSNETIHEEYACQKSGIFYREGEMVPSSNCETCYCMKGDIRCTFLSCLADPAFDHCQPSNTTDDCCPTKFLCDTKTVHNKNDSTFQHSNQAESTWTKGPNREDSDLVDEKGTGTMKSTESWVVLSTIPQKPVNTRFQGPVKMYATLGGKTMQKNEASLKPAPFHVDEFARQISYTSSGRAFVINRKSKKKEGNSTDSPITVPEISNLKIERYAMMPLKVKVPNKQTLHSKMSFMPKKTNRSHREIDPDGGLMSPRMPVTVIYKHSIVNFYPNHLTTLPRADFHSKWMKTSRAENEPQKRRIAQNDIRTHISSTSSDAKGSTERYGSTTEELPTESSSILKSFLKQFLNTPKLKPGPTAPGSPKDIPASKKSDRTAKTDIGVETLDGTMESQFVAETKNSNHLLPNSPKGFTKSSQRTFLFKLAGCNIYGKIYDVGKIVQELSGDCLRCTCTYAGVECEPLRC